MIPYVIGLSSSRLIDERIVDVPELMKNFVGLPQVKSDLPNVKIADLISQQTLL